MSQLNAYKKDLMTIDQIEMEIVDPSQIQNKIELFNMLHKVFDLLKCV